MNLEDAAALEVTHRDEAELQRSLKRLQVAIDAAVEVIEQDKASWNVSDRGFRYRVVELT